MDMEILKELKQAYSAQLINFTLKAIEDNLLISSLTAREISSKIFVLQAIQLIANSWHEMDIKTYRTALLIAYSDIENVDLIKSVMPFASPMNQVPNLEPFLAISENLQCFDKNDYQNIVE